MVHYFTYYATKNSYRAENFAGEDKIDYICEVLKKIGEDVILVSSAKSKGDKYLPREQVKNSDDVDVLFFSSIPNLNTLVHAIDILWGYVQLIWYVLFHVERSDFVLVYHSLGYRNIFKWLHKIKKFKYILEVEELYQYIDANKNPFKKNENLVFSEPDAYIFSNEILAEQVNIFKKEQVIINGVYKCEKKRNSYHMRNSFEKIRIVYAGSLEKQKGIDYVIKAAKYLSDIYEIHILGFGSKKDLERVERLIKEYSQEHCCKVFYDGVLKGEEYFEFLQSCHIGICIQNEKDMFNQYEYPSKVFSYLSNGLVVVINDLMQVRRSSVYDYLNIAKSSEPQDVANAVLSCEFENNTPNEILFNLESEFIDNFKKILKYTKNKCKEK